jgi:hypothetical protein
VRVKLKMAMACPEDSWRQWGAQRRMKKIEGSLRRDDIHGNVSWAQLVMRSSATGDNSF